MDLYLFAFTLSFSTETWAIQAELDIVFLTSIWVIVFRNS